MKNLKNALLLRQLKQLKQFGYRYTSVSIYKESEPNLMLPSTLEKLKSQTLKCHLCELSKSRTHVVFGEGNPQADVMFVGEGPGVTEDSTGQPFVGRSGELLTKIIENVLFVKREEIYIANIVKCRPPNNRTPSPEEAHTCKSFLLKQIELIKPKIIITLGSTAYHYMTGDDTGITKIRGTVLKQKGYTLVPTYHPSFLLRNPSAKKEVFEDMKKVKTLMRTL
ncbi:MAG: uracil-DNA glycosylase [Sulfurovum sp.]|nr:uracil-DNA glycosylase [Sulfurovum sp.]MCB4748635.1 uracil-DNA glycosylase [Sulfurovum sp.]MCB4762511.1 uracil-DNA glycosylase [Sulfurovum sp.]MCB4775077.1 uracil-DNA glycosylase [Sulfurovum sp.]